ncbi:MAG: insulinase family protein [Mesorhizobium sp.]|nr:insulinase family protein [Mesorhizobium sp.]
MGVEVSRLSNGLTVATETLPSIESVALGAWVKSGARNERDEEHGMAHLLEHMAFKGTKRRTAFEIASEIENVGGEINAATSVETTSYYARVLSDDVPLAVDILSDILQESEFDPEELEREQHVILQEIGAAHDTPDDIVFDRFTETAFRHQTIGRSILGTPETVKSFTKRLGGFRAKATGNIPQYAQYVGGDFREDRDLMDAQIVLGFEGRAYHVRDFYASQVLSMILGGGMSSRLFQEVREKRGLCYSVYAFHWGFSDTGIFGVHAATGQSDIAKLVPVIIDELQKAGENILQEELERARAQYRAGLIMSAESPASRASQIARQLLLFGRPIAKEELMERLSALTVERLTDLSARLFSTKPTLTAVGPVGTLAPYEAILESLAGPTPTARRLAV